MAIAMAAFCAAPAAQAQLSSCTLTISTGGSLGTNSNATELSSRVLGGGSAVVTPVIVGLLPTITMTAPRMTESPSGYQGTPVVSMAYRSLLGGNQDWTSAGSSYRALGLTDVLTIDMRITDPNGFRAGQYSAATTLTCQR